MPTRDKLGGRLGHFLMTFYRGVGMSRRAAADRAGLSEAYLCHLLAGDVGMPRRDTWEGLYAGWGFNAIDALFAAGYISREHIDAFLAREMHAGQKQLTSDMTILMDRLLELEPELREPSVQLYLRHLSVIAEARRLAAQHRSTGPARSSKVHARAS